jgi:integrase
MTDKTIKFKFSKTTVKAASAPTEPGTRRTYYDTLTPKLALRVTSSGHKSFYVIKRQGSEQPWIKLGSFPDMTVEQAQIEAAKVLGEYAKGANPAELKRTLKGELTFREAFEILMREKKKKDGRPLADKTKSDYQDVFEKHLTPIQSKKLSAIESDQVQAIHNGVTKIGSSQANKALAVISSVFSFMKKLKKFAGPNPAEGIQKNYEEQRDRFLSGEELVRFFAELDKSSNVLLRDYFYIALLTGARRSNVSEMCWEDIDLKQGLWRLKKTKNGTPQNVTLSPEASLVLQALKASKGSSAFVFPGVGRTGHIVEPKSAWKDLLKRSEIKNLRIHDLRRTLGSWQANTGASLLIIAKSLNHLSLQSTEIYARLNLEPVRNAVNIATSAMLAAGEYSRPLAPVQTPEQ